MSKTKVNKTILFGCWNLGGCDIDAKHNALSKVIDHIISNNPEGTIDNAIVLGDNYYGPKKKHKGIKIFNRGHFESGMDCLKGLPGKNVYMLVGNHEIDPLIELDDDKNTLGESFCSIDKQRDYIKDSKISIMDDPVRGLRKPSTNLNADILFINTNVYDSLRYPPKPKKDKPKDKDKSKSKSKSEDIPSACADEISDKMNIFEDQNDLIKDIIINSPKKNVIICGHEPLLNYRDYKGKNVHEWHPQILKVLSDIDPDDIESDKSIYYICADTHLYQEFTLNFKNGLIVKQYTVGTGGNVLDKTATPNKPPIYIDLLNNIKFPLSSLMCYFSELPILHRSISTYGYLECENKEDGTLNFDFRNVTQEGIDKTTYRHTGFVTRRHARKKDTKRWASYAEGGIHKKTHKRRRRKHGKTTRKSRRKSSRKPRKSARSKSKH